MSIMYISVFLCNNVFCPCSGAAVGIWSRSLCPPREYSVFVQHAQGGA